MSQRTNIKLHVLAEQIVEHAASSDNVTPISLGAARYLRSRPPAADAATHRG